MDARTCPNCKDTYTHTDLDLANTFGWEEIIEYIHCHNCGCYYKNIYAICPELTEQEIVDI